MARADVGEHGAGPVVDGHDRVVVDVAALELADPRDRGLAVLLDQLLLGEPVEVVADLRPLLGDDLVAVVVERRDDAQAVGVERLLALEQLVRLATDGEHEVRRQVGVVARRREDDLLGHGGVVLAWVMNSDSSIWSSTKLRTVIACAVSGTT